MEKDNTPGSGISGEAIFAFLGIGLLVLGFTLTFLPLIFCLWGFFVSKYYRFWNGIGIIAAVIYVMLDIKFNWLISFYNRIVIAPDKTLVNLFDKGYITILYIICSLFAVLFIWQSYRDRTS